MTKHKRKPSSTGGDNDPLSRKRDLVAASSKSTRSLIYLVVFAVIVFAFGAGKYFSRPAPVDSGAVPTSSSSASSIDYYPQAVPAVFSGDVLKIPENELSGTAKFYSYVADGTPLRFFAMKSSDGVYRAAFDSCDVCFQAKKGYHQEGDDMVCNNCGRHFPSDQINVVTGGCNPAPIERKVENGSLVMSKEVIDAGKSYF